MIINSQHFCSRPTFILFLLPTILSSKKKKKKKKKTKKKKEPDKKVYLQGKGGDLLTIGN